MTVNASEITNEHWTKDLQLVGVRIIGEACHFTEYPLFTNSVKYICFDIIYLYKQS